MARDRNDVEISAGDTVEFVYGGDPYTMTVESIGEMHGVPSVRGTVAVQIHAAATRVTEKAEPADTEQAGMREAAEEVPAGSGPSARKTTKKTPTELEESNGD